ncbi:MAG: TSUP family transporter [candidate division Zixibacteria bacterium]|nr:TSUP family transporter [candidate division Zixibacteria bacterium]
MQILTLLFVGAVGGFLSGLLGIGGGVVLIPLLISVGHASIKMAASVSIVVIVFASSFGSFAHYGRGNLHVPTGIWMGLAGIGGALGGSLFSDVFPEDFFYYLYMGLITVAATMLVFRPQQELAPPEEYQLRKPQTVLVGLLKGFVTGVLGIGGSFIVIPLMIYSLGMPIHKAVGTSLVVTLFSAVAGLLGKIAIGHFDLQMMVWVVLGTIPATQIGVWGAQRSGPRFLRLSLLMLLIGILIWMIWHVIL